MTTPSEPIGEATISRWTESPEHPDMWLDPADDDRETRIELSDERATLVEYLRIYRRTMEMKCADLTTEQMARRSIPPSTMSMLGLVRHMAEVERVWFRRVMAGEDAPRLYCTAESRDEDWDGARDDPELVAQAWSTWRGEVGFAVDFTSRADDLGIVGQMRDGRSMQLREVLVHMIEEYARHCGHADLLREQIDGRIGQ